MKLNSKTCKNIIIFQIFFVIIMNYLIDGVGLPSVIVYFTDLLMATLCIYMLLYRKHTLRSVGARVQSVIIFFLIFYMILDGVLNVVNPLLIVWAARKTFRGLIFLVACVRFLELEDVEKIFKALFIVQLVNIVLTSYQFFALGLRQDHLGGIFGTAQGSNAWSNLFFCILLTYYTVCFIQEKSYLKEFIVVIASTIIIAALAEIKVFFVEFPLIIIAVMIFTRVSFKKCILAIVGVGMFYFALGFFAKYYPLFYARFTSIESILGMGRDVGTGYNLSRLGAFESISKIFFNDSIFRKMWGYGLGSCETSSLAFLNSPFYKTHGQYNYIWFGHMITFLETGYIGIVTTVGMFSSFILYAFKIHKKMKDNMKVHSISVFVMTICGIAILNFWYNNFIRSEMQYLIYFAISTVFICVKSECRS